MDMFNVIIAAVVILAVFYFAFRLGANNITFKHLFWHWTPPFARKWFGTDPNDLPPPTPPVPPAV